jgi:CheY-like chemotaxis protein
MAILLGFSGNETAMAFSGPEALTQVESFRPDAVLLDIGLPGMDGYEVCRSIRSLQYGSDIKIIAVTGWGQDSDRQQTRQAGFDAHLVKPVDYNKVLETLALGEK